MEENKQEAVSPVEATPASLDEVILGLRGFGIEENEDILTLKAGGKEHRLRISNIPTEAELVALLAVEDQKGYAWLQRIKAEILSRSISWIDGVPVKSFEGKMFTDPTTGNQMLWQPALRNVIMTWGMEIVGVLWKVFMVHSQRIEDRLKDAFPDSAIMTDVEKRFVELAVQDIEDQAREMIKDRLDNMAEEGAETSAETETKKS
jgi:hypothetical protein